MQRRRFATAAALGALAGCATVPPVEPVPDTAAAPPPAGTGLQPPPSPREARAAWVASVSYIDWPSRAGLRAAQQRAEMTALLDRASQIGLNVLMVQVRSAADALYASGLEPWSEFLTGEQGRAPDEPWDPLAEWVDGAHRRGMELHAWFNPYRARTASARSALAARHVASRHPEWVRRYADMLWLDPGEPAAAAHTLDVITDVVRRYDVDAVHLDDYFYPYPVTPPGAAAELPFPDDATFARYAVEGGALPRDDWRRDNVNRFVERLYRAVHGARPEVRVGISPFGLGRPDLRPAGIAGFSQYDRLFADVERWLAEGWLDILAPQLYWPIARREQAFEVLLDYWIARNGRLRLVWPGLFTSAVASAQPPWPAAEIVEQIQRTRQRPGASGHAHFSLRTLLQDRDGIAGRLQREAYARATLPPELPWLHGAPWPAPRLQRDPQRDELLLQPGQDASPRLWSVWSRHGGRWQFTPRPGAQRRIALAPDPLGLPPDAVVVAAVDRTGQEGQRAEWRAAA